MTESEMLSAIADDFTERLRNADDPTIDEYVQRHPELEADIRRLLPSIKVMEQLSSREQQDRSFERRTKRLVLEPDGLLGDFRIVREIGRGGMGVVYEAEQQSLKRRVALKILGPTTNSPKQLARFQSEAKAAARLHHTNIVSVYGVGEHDGLSYYAMQLIDGMTLSDAIAMNAAPGHDFIIGQDPPTDADRPDATRGDDVTRTVAGDSSEVRDPSGDINWPGGEEWPDPKDGAQPKHLNEINRTLHSPSRWVEIARLGSCVADALHYAHSNGVLHRDIKPSNLMIDRHGVIWITDFGLAHHDDRDAVTATGDIVGTLRYMAPEQFSGQFDGRCDTYSLGMTIYEMLTLRPAFTEVRHAPLINQKTTSAPPRPRSLNPDIPRDLETIVLKACAVDPASRYPNPGELAADLRRFCEDRPIHARRVKLRERVWRWSRRNPLAATLGVLSGVLLASVFIVFAVLNVQLRGAVKKAEDETNRASFQETLANARLKITRQVQEHLQGTIDQIMAGLELRSLPEPLAFELDGQMPVSVGILGQSDLDNLSLQLQSNQRFADLFGEKIELEEGTARAVAKAGEIQQRLGQYDAAAASYLDALQRFRQLLRFDRKSIPFVTEQARMHGLLAIVRLLVAEPEILPEKIGIQEGLDLLESDDGILTTAEGQFALVNLMHAKHLVFLISGGKRRSIAVEPGSTVVDSEIQDLERAIEVMRRLIGQDPENSDYQRMSIRLQTDRGRLAVLGGDRQNAAIHLGSAASLLQERILENPEDTPLRCELAYVLCLAPQKLEGVNPAIARGSLTMLAAQLEQLVQTNPTATHARFIADRARAVADEL